MKAPKIEVMSLRQKKAIVLRHYLIIAQVHQAHKEMLRFEAEFRKERN